MGGRLGIREREWKRVGWKEEQELENYEDDVPQETSASVILLPRPDMNAGTKDGGAGCVVNSWGSVWQDQDRLLVDSFIVHPPATQRQKKTPSSRLQGPHADAPMPTHTH